MSKNVKDILQMIEENGIKMIDFKMVDINGQYRHVTIPAENFSEETMKSGIGFDASNYGYAVVEKSDMVFIPHRPFLLHPHAYDDGQCDDHRQPRKQTSAAISPQHCSRGRTVYEGLRHFRHNAHSSRI